VLLSCQPFLEARKEEGSSKDEMSKGKGRERVKKKERAGNGNKIRSRSGFRG